MTTPTTEEMVLLDIDAEMAADNLGWRARRRGDQLTIYGPEYDGTGKGTTDKLRVTRTTIVGLTGNNERTFTKDVAGKSRAQAVKALNKALGKVAQ